MTLGEVSAAAVCCWCVAGVCVCFFEQCLEIVWVVERIHNAAL